MSALLLLGLASLCAAQNRLEHAPGPLVVGDINQDGTDDFLILDPAGYLRAYRTGSFFPHYRTAARTPFAVVGIREMPVFHDGHLWVVREPANSPATTIELYRVNASGSVVLLATETVPTVAQGAVVTDRQLVARQRDLDGDGRLDATLYWMERRQGTTRVWTVDLTPVPTAPRAIGLPPAVPSTARLVEAHSVRTLTRLHDDIMLTVSSGVGELFGGFGFVLDNPRNTTNSNVWFPGYPSLLADDPSYTDSIVAHGRYAPMIGIDSPLVRTSLGISFLPWPDARPPFVGFSGTILPTSLTGRSFPLAAADYNRDGTDEMVWLDNVRQRDLTELIVTDPGPGRAEIRVYDLEPGTSGTHQPRYAVTGDFNGDALPDLLFLSRIPTEPQRSLIGIFLNQGPGSISLLRVL